MHPIENGLAEYLAYLSLSNLGFEISYDESELDYFAWIDNQGNEVIATAKRTIFSHIKENDGN